MAKQINTFEIALAPREKGQSAYRWLYAALREDILAGRLRPGMRVPATRDLARQYGVSRGTVVRAFEELKSEGYIEGSIGSGTYVSRVLPEDLLPARCEGKEQGAVPAKRRRKLSDYGRRVELFPNFTNRPSYAFRANLPALDLFPVDLWAQLAARRLRRASPGLFMVCDPMGYLPLRRAVADYLITSRGVRCVPGHVAIIAGVQEALDLATRILINPGDRVCMDDPGYPGAANVFEAAGAKVAPMDVDDEGMKLDKKKLKGARLVYITPGHQFPLGITMSLPRRLQLLEWARKSGAMIFEDDYDSEYRYSGRPVPALQGLDAHGTVLFAGSFSKVLFPSLRLGYLVVPDDLVDRFTAAISITCRHAPLLDQAVLCDFITEGHFGRHLRRMRQIYAERLAVLLEGAKEKWSGLLEITGVEAGLQTAAWLCGDLKAETVSSAAKRRKVEVSSLGPFSRRPMQREGLQLGFAAVDEREIRRGVQELAVVMEECRKTH
jgi:GntR family transcriptional regulator/MocR family aminotransferase